MPAPTSKPAIVLEWGAVYVRCGVAGEPCPRVRLPSPLGALAQGGERLNETAWRGALDEFVAKLFAEELLTMPQKRIVLNVEDAALPRALRRALADALYDAGAERLAFAPSIACAAVGGDAAAAFVDGATGVADETAAPDRATGITFSFPGRRGPLHRPSRPAPTARGVARGLAALFSDLPPRSGGESRDASRRGSLGRPQKENGCGHRHRTTRLVVHEGARKDVKGVKVYGVWYK